MVFEIALSFIFKVPQYHRAPL